MVASFVAFLTTIVGCYAQTQKFLSRPGQETVTLEITVNSDPALLAPGYLFITPYKSYFSHTKEPGLWGPHIFSQDGTLVWAGNHTVEERAWALHVCSYEGQRNSHLCYGDGHFITGHTSGFNRFFDSTYTEVERFGATGNLTCRPDGHELNTPASQNGRTLLQDIYVPTSMGDLTRYGRPKDGYVQNSCFQEIDIKSGKVNFQWCSLDHVPLEETFTELPGQPKVAGAGGLGGSALPWDYFHINSIDQDDIGDYYVSGRATGTVYKIAGAKSKLGKPGDIIWRLGGRKNNFKMLDRLLFGFQHHARIRNVTKDTTTISLFDNAWAGSTNFTTSPASSGMVFELNTITMTAKLVERYIQPDGRLVGVEGSCQLLDNGNVFMGWGSAQTLSEHTPGLPGKLLYHAKFGPGLHLESYRSFKYPWIGEPADPPDVFAYQKDCTSDLLVYMSWNGATEHKGWKIFLANSAHDRGVEIDSIWPRSGYETVADTGRPSSNFKRYVYVHALGADDKVLATSKHQKVFVPSRSFAQQYECNSTRCTTDSEYVDSNSQASSC